MNPAIGEQNLPVLIRKLLARELDSLRPVTATVTARQDADCTITADPIGEEPPLNGIRLRSIVAGNLGVVAYPKVDTKVTIVYYDTQGTEGVVIAEEEIDKFEIRFSDDYRMTFNPNGNFELWVTGLSTLNDGSFDGLVKVGPLVAKINRLENKLNDLISAFNSHGHTAFAAPPTIVPLSIPVTAISGLTAQADLENPHITHGPHA